MIDDDGMAPAALPPPFTRLGPPLPGSPVIVAVPHAGRFYPPALLARSRVGRAALETLEDRHADLLAADATATGATIFVATYARAWIDLNRNPRELDPAMIVPRPERTIASAKVRGGIGLIPRRLAGHGEIYPAPLRSDELAERIATVHAPWHAALASALDQAHETFGFAVLLDLHSMPPLGGAVPPLAVVGDRHRSSAAPRLVATAMHHAANAGLRPALNAPYAGGYALERHGRPREGIHALQLELCRSLYLDEVRLAPGAGLPALQRFVADLVDRLTTVAPPSGLPIAAE